MASDSVSWALTIPSDLRVLGLARAFVETVCQVAGLNEAQTHQVVLAADEAVNNVMRHAYQDRPNAPVHIQCRAEPGRLEVVLIDEGEPFDLGAVPHLNPAELRIGGRGVFLMRKLMDELSVEKRPEGGNVLRMVKLVKAEPACHEA
jgi:anti-sigma regulatory factor (Ser/Thr protein kinase)